MCLASGNEFEEALANDDVEVLYLCDGFKYEATSPMQVNSYSKAIVCAGTCVIDGSSFEYDMDEFASDDVVSENAAFTFGPGRETAEGPGSITLASEVTFCHVEFSNFLSAVRSN